MLIWKISSTMNVPSSLTDPENVGTLRPNHKSAPTTTVNNLIGVHAIICQVYDMAAMVHMEKPGGASFTFADYIAKDLLPCTNQHHLDTVWDHYPEGGLKAPISSRTRTIFFSFCSKQLINEKLITTTDEGKVLFNHDRDLSMLQPDTLIILTTYVIVTKQKHFHGIK